MEDSLRYDISVLLDVGVEVVLVTAGSKGIYFGTIDVETGAPGTYMHKHKPCISYIDIEHTPMYIIFSA